MKCISAFLSLCLIAAFVVAQPNYDFSKLKREHFGRGVIAIRENPSTVAVSWRYLSSDPMDESFDVYRNGEKVNKYPIRNATFFQDIYKGTESVLYTVKAIQSKTESCYQLPSDAPAGYLNIPLNRPENGTTPAGQSYFYAPNDASIGDVDGDGEYEIILKWDPSNAHDNSHDGYTGEVYFDCYKLNGQHLWRINLGRNIRAGAHYTQFMVFDFDGDGKAEVVMKTADGTVDGKGKVIGDAQADYRNEQGRILTGPEYLTVFNGLTGEAIQTIDYVPGRGNLMDWGDNRGNRSDRFLACVAYLDGIHPSVVMCRGYYTRTVLAAYDWNGKELKERWIFDSNHPGCEDYAGQGNHNLRVVGGRQTGLPVMICVELDDEGETPEGVPFASILASVQHLGVAAVGFRCSGGRIDTLSILGQHAAFAAVPLMPVLRSRGRSPEEIQVHAMQALRAGGDLFLLGNSIDDAQLAAAEEALADFRPTDRVIEQDRETLFMACEAEAFYLQPDGLSFCEPIPCQYDMGADILEAEAQGCDVLKVYVDSPEDAENFAENSHMIRLPVCISSHHEVALEMALMEYNGRAFVDLQSELTDSELYTLAKGYGAVVV